MHNSNHNHQSFFSRYLYSQFVAGVIVGFILCATFIHLFRVFLIQKELPQLEKTEQTRFSQITTPTSILKNINKFDRFARRKDLEPIFVYVAMYKVESPSSVSVPQSNTTLSDNMRYADDIWDQASIIFTTGVYPITLSEQEASDVAEGKLHVLQNKLKPGQNAVPIFVVKNVPNTSGITSQSPEEGRSYIVVDEDAFKDSGRTLAHEIGHFLGLHHPSEETDQTKISGLMGNVGLLDLAEQDIQSTRAVASELQKKQLKLVY